MDARTKQTTALRVSACGAMAVALAWAAVIAVPAPAIGQPRVAGRTIAESDPPSWPKGPEAPAGAPNVLIILTDDVGFGAASTFGGPIPTPALDSVAQNGTRYNRFNTAGICSPTRAALLTGRDNHNVNMETVTNFATGFDGYNSVIPKSAATVAQVLKSNGFNTAAFGKWHLAPDWEESRLGPYDHWPTGMGFDYFYGFLEGDASQWNPALVENTNFVDPPTTDPNYIFDADMADHAIHWMNEQHAIAPDKPFFMYYATGAAHTPHHAPQEWLAKFRGKFDMGWDELRRQTFERQKILGIIPANTKLTPRPAFLPAWASLKPDQKRIYARLFEAFAAQLAFSDHEIGRVLDHLKQTGQLKNTLVFFIEGDNGSSAEGGARGLLYEQSFLNRYAENPGYVMSRIDDIGGPLLYNHYPAAFAWATTAPFQYYKQVASHFGGIRNGMAISWPGHVRAGALCQQFLHVSDITPTILDATGTKMPDSFEGTTQMPLDGISFASSFTRPDAASPRRLQVFEVGQNMGIYQDGWWAGTTPTKAPWDMTKPGGTPLEQRSWELYHVDTDFSQATDLAKAQPAKLAAMQQMFWAEAARKHILPLHDLSEGREGKPTLGANRTEFSYPAGITRVPLDAAPKTVGRSWTIDADFMVPANGGKGVIVAQGGRFGGYSLYLQNSRPAFHYNALGERQYKIASSSPLSAGEHHVTADFQADSAAPGAGGTMTIAVDGTQVAQGRIDNTLTLWISHSEGLDIGRDTTTPVTEDYTVADSGFDGEIKQVLFHLK